MLLIAENIPATGEMVPLIRIYLSNTASLLVFGSSNTDEVVPFPVMTYSLKYIYLLFSLFY